MRALISIPPQRATAIDKAFSALTRSALSPIGDKPPILDLVGEDAAARAVLNRSAVAPVGTGDTGFGAEPGVNLAAAYVATLAPISAAAAIIAQGMPIALGRSSSMPVPAREGAPSAAVDWVGEGRAIAARAYALNEDCVLARKKFGIIVAVSREVAKRTGGDAVIRQLMREDAAASLDGAYFSADAATTETHGGMRAGIAALTGYAGGDRIAVEHDLAALSDVVSAGGSGQIVFVVSPRRANRVRIKLPDLAREFTFLPSLAVGDADMIAVDPASWAHGFGDEIEVDVSPAATVHMETEPSDEFAGSGGEIRAFWQTDTLAYRMVADVAFAPRRDNAVAWATGLSW